MKILLTFCFSLIVLSIAAQNKTYYVSASGNDSNTGTEINAPWKSLAKVNATTFKPGDVIMLEGNQTFKGSVNITAASSGATDNPVIIKSYGIGRATIDAGTGNGIWINNAEFVEVRDLIVTGNGRYNNNGTGIYINTNRSDKMLDGIIVSNTDAAGFYWSGIGIGADEGATKGFVNLKIINCNVYENGMAGIQSWGSWNGALGLAAFSHKNMYIGYTKAYDNHGLLTYTSNWSGTGILMSGVENGLVEYCEAYENGKDNGCNTGGPVGIWFANTKDCIIQYCESYNNKAGKSYDGGGFDIDGGAQNCIIQYCYSHDNEGAGFALFEWGNNIPFIKNTIRYNISQNDGRKNSYGGITFWATDAAHKLIDCEVYNNTIYVNKDSVVNGKPAAVKFIGNNMKGLKIRNNIFYVTADVNMIFSASTFDTSAVLFQNNNYFDTTNKPTFVFRNTYTSLPAWKNAARGQETLGNKSLGFSNDPWFVNPGGGKKMNPAQGGDLTYLTAYMLHPKSAMIDAGLNLKDQFDLNIGNKDYYNNDLNEIESFDLGANEFNPAKFIVMPLRFKDFKLYKQDKQVKLSWDIESEEQVKLFTIETSSDGVLFKSNKNYWIKNVGYKQTFYEILDLSPTKRTYYRVKAVTESGKVTYSKILMIINDVVNKPLLYPNPVNQELNIASTNFAFNKVLIKNMLNAIVYEKDVLPGNSDFKLNLEFLKPGLYYVELISAMAGKIENSKFIKM